MDRQAEAENVPISEEQKKSEKEKGGERELVKEKELKKEQKHQHTQEPNVPGKKAHRLRDGKDELLTSKKCIHILSAFIEFRKSTRKCHS